MFERGLSFIHLLDLPAVRVALDRMAETTSCLALEPSLPRNSCFLLRCMSPEMAHLYGPAARCKPKMTIRRCLVLRFCIRPLNGTFVFLAIMDIRAHPILFSERPIEAGRGRNETRKEGDNLLQAGQGHAVGLYVVLWG